MEGVDRVLPTRFLVGLILLLCISFTNSYNRGEFSDSREEHSVTYTYDRIDEVNKECAFVLASAPDLKPDDNRMYGIKEELSFMNGDWWQEGNGASLMPFDDKYVTDNTSNIRSQLNLLSFWVTDVDRSHKSRSTKSVSVSGIMHLGITLEGLFIQRPSEKNLRFDIWPGHSQLSIRFQGIYTESKEKGGERVMCMLGNAVLPSRLSDSNDPWEWVKEPGYSNQPPFLQDDQILLVLRYPQTFSLTSRAIRGSMKSLNPKSNLKYFDEVHISSWLGISSDYVFGSEKIVSKACDPYPYPDSLIKGGIDVYKGLDFCSIVERFNGEAITVVPNWKCSGTDAFCAKLGPFVSNQEINATDGGFKDVKLVLQDIRCKKGDLDDNVDFSRVSAVFRAVPPFENQFNAAQRTGLNNMTLSSEGVWKSSSGQLCMVGCLGIVDDGCNSRICMYIPLLFSIQQRSIVTGTISNIDKSTKLYFPLSFEKLVRTAELWDQYSFAHPYYKYSKIDSAGVVLEKNEPFNFGTVIKKSLLTYPKLEDTGAFQVSLSLLSEDLTLHVSAFPDPVPTSRPPRTDVQMEIISVGPLFGRFWSPQNGTTQEETPYHSKAEYTEKQLLLNVSAQLSISGDPYNNVSLLFLEGIYDQHVGEMYLIGCRDVRASWKVLHESMDLESGLDCLVEAVVSYPPTSARWLVSPSARISISSQRSEDDPLYFSPIKLQTLPVMYRKQREDILSRRGVEGILRVVTLSVAISFLLSQLFYIRANAESVPFISLVMLGVQALGYSLPLITGAEALYKRLASDSYEGPSYELEKSQWLQVIDYTVKVLVLVLFSLTLRLVQKVLKSRIRLLTRAPNQPHLVPGEKKVLLITVIVHLIGYVIVLIIHSVSTSQRPLQTEVVVDSMGNSQTLRQWETELEEYVGLIQDFFLLPQIIGNVIWEIHHKPLRKLYFMGITVVRVLPHIYDCIRSPIANPYFSEQYQFVNPQLDFFSKFGDVAISLVAILLAVTVYVQQRWNYDKLSQKLVVGQRRLLPMGSKVYERLSSFGAFEAELVSCANDDDTRTKGLDDTED